jgi:hypothetical protein
LWANERGDVEHLRLSVSYASLATPPTNDAAALHQARLVHV